MPSIDMPLDQMRQYKPTLYRESDFEEFWDKTIDRAIAQPHTAKLNPASAKWYPYCMQTGATYRYLTRIPGVRAGNMIVEGTRIGVHDVVGLFANGSSVDDVVRSFP